MCRLIGQVLVEESEWSVTPTDIALEIHGHMTFNRQKPKNDALNSKLKCGVLCAHLFFVVML